MTKQIKVALIGAGGWGRQHARIFAERPDVEFCAIAGRTAERTEARAREYGVRAYTDIGEMLEREQPDFVSVCLPNEGHFAPTLQVIEAAFPLLVEKPLVFDLAEADTLLAEAEARNLFFASTLTIGTPSPFRWQSRRLTTGVWARLCSPPGASAAKAGPGIRSAT